VTQKVYFSKSKSKLAIIMCHTWMTTDGMIDKNNVHKICMVVFRQKIIMFVSLFWACLLYIVIYDIIFTEL
jgi:hypothetical protein